MSEQLKCEGGRCIWNQLVEMQRARYAEAKQIHAQASALQAGQERTNLFGRSRRMIEQVNDMDKGVFAIYKREAAGKCDMRGNCGMSVPRPW